jgi:hypothetical protein
MDHLLRYRNQMDPCGLIILGIPAEIGFTSPNHGGTNHCIPTNPNTMKTLFNPERKEVLTYSECLEPAMEITDPQDAQQYLANYVAYTQKHLDREPRNDGMNALEIVKINLGYFAGYYDNETRKRVERLFNCEHPVFGSIEKNGPPTMEEAFKKGKEHCNQTTMKTLLTIITLALSTSVHAALINLTPGGWEYAAHTNNAPPPLLQLLHQEAHNDIAFYDEARSYQGFQGWVSQFGVLNGGTYFFADLTLNGIEPFAAVNWNFDALPQYGVRFLDVVGFNNGDFWESIYLVTGNTMFDSGGDLLLSLNGTIDINSISFYGTTPTTTVPDSGSTIALMGLGLVALIGLKKHYA